MAKKRKVKKKAKKPKLKKVKAKRVKVRIAKRKMPAKMKAVKAPRMPARFEAAYTLSLAGGIIILIGGILAILALKIWGEQVLAMTTIGMAVGLVCGLAILIATAASRRKPRMAGIVVLIFSIIALATPPTYGLIFGPILSLIGAIMLLRR